MVRAEMLGAAGTAHFKRVYNPMGRSMSHSLQVAVYYKIWPGRVLSYGLTFGSLCIEESYMEPLGKPTLVVWARNLKYWAYDLPLVDLPSGSKCTNLKYIPQAIS